MNWPLKSCNSRLLVEASFLIIGHAYTLFEAGLFAPYWLASESNYAEGLLADY